MRARTLRKEELKKRQERKMFMEMANKQRLHGAQSPSKKPRTSRAERMRSKRGHRGIPRATETSAA